MYLSCSSDFSPVLFLVNIHSLLTKSATDLQDKGVIDILYLFLENLSEMS